MKKLVYMLIITVFTSLELYAQGGPGGPGGPSDVDPGAEDNGVPIDGGISMLAAAGVAYGIRKLKQQKKGGKTEFYLETTSENA